MKKKRVFSLEVLERDYETDKKVVVFRSDFPQVKATSRRIVKTRKQLEKIIKLSPLKDYEKEAMLNRIWFILNHWYPTHFYRVVMNQR